MGKNTKGLNPWLFSFYLQQFYETFDFFEKTLKLVPGLYSAWLRLWGAKIGSHINWAPACKIMDRPFLVVGNRSLIGNLSYISSHAIKKNSGSYLLYVKKTIIEEDCVVSYTATLGPGAVMRNRSYIEAGAALFPNQVLEEDGILTLKDVLSNISSHGDSDISMPPKG